LVAEPIVGGCGDCLFEALVPVASVEMPSGEIRGVT
jgi:hypothetical protein